MGCISGLVNTSTVSKTVEDAVSLSRSALWSVQSGNEERETGHVARSSWCLLCAEILFLIVTAIHVSQISQPRSWISFSTTSFTNFFNFSILWKSAGLSVQELSWENAAQSSHLGLRCGAQPGMVSCTYAEGTGLRPSPLGFRELTQCSWCTQCCASCPVTRVSLCSITWGRLSGWTL